MKTMGLAGGAAPVAGSVPGYGCGSATMREENVGQSKCRGEKCWTGKCSTQHEGAKCRTKQCRFKNAVKHVGCGIRTFTFNVDNVCSTQVYL